MKRRYKEGDWFRIRLDAHVDAVGILARACRSRLFGYFFAVPAEHTLAHEALKQLRAADAATCALFGGAPLEEARWNIIATSVPFDREAWPFPQFVSRGAFGRVWTRHSYDPQTLQVRESETIDETAARGAPDARFAGAEQLEDLLRERLCGAAPREPLAIYQLHSGFDTAALQILSHGGRVQVSEVLTQPELEAIAHFIEHHPDVELRVHGFSRHAFDVRTLRPFARLRALSLDVRLCEHLAALEAMPDLQRLRLGAQDCRQPLQVLAELPALRDLEVHGKNADVRAIAQCSQIESLALVDTPAIDREAFASAPALRELTLAHSAQTRLNLGQFAHLTRLELRDVPLSELPDVSQNAALETIVLRNIRVLHDLTPIACATALRRLEISGTPQLNVEHFKPLRQLANLRRFHVDLGSRRKEREVYRLLNMGTKHHG